MKKTARYYKNLAYFGVVGKTRAGSELAPTFFGHTKLYYKTGYFFNKLSNHSYTYTYTLNIRTFIFTFVTKTFFFFHTLCETMFYMNYS